MSAGIQLNGRTYTIVGASAQSITLRGPRGGEYAFVRNQHDHDAWALIASGGRTTWFHVNAAGDFETACSEKHTNANQSEEIPMPDKSGAQ